MKNEWEEVKALGEGGQSVVSLVRRPTRVEARRRAYSHITQTDLPDLIPYSSELDDVSAYSEALAALARDDFESELGAKKLFKIRKQSTPEQSKARFLQEVEALKEGGSGLPKLLDSNDQECWLVTEYFARGTLENNLSVFEGRPLEALSAFDSLLKTVARLHKAGTIHRDIKPANIFLKRDNSLVLGDFGIVHQENHTTRLTVTNETVGPGDFRPPWADLAGPQDVDPRTDVYMLGKALWSMVSGRVKLPREYFLRDAYNLAKIFENQPEMFSINEILKHSVVEHIEQCAGDAGVLREIVRNELNRLTKDGQRLDPEVPRPCRVCGIGFYRRAMRLEADPPPVITLRLTRKNPADEVDGIIDLSMFLCNSCGHCQLFAPPPYRVSRI